jgi:nicotinate-nucleotide pyrophosphorylase (carboxylating)
MTLNAMAKNILKLALMEDIGAGDITTKYTVDPKLSGKVAARNRSAMVLSGSEIFLAAFEAVDPQIRCHMAVKDGQHLPPNTQICEISGPATGILTAERVALNFLSHLSGIATLTDSFVKAVGPSGPKILDTRKTLPGLRVLEKLAVLHGGGHNHRFSLHDGILIKDNHIRAAGSIQEALKLAKQQAPHHLKIEVEVDNLEQLQTALEYKADIILLDNMPPPILKEAVGIAERHFAPNPRAVILEASGGINLQNIAQAAETGVDYISVGALTHSAPCADVGLDWL